MSLLAKGVTIWQSVIMDLSVKKNIRLTKMNTNKCRTPIHQKICYWMQICTLEFSLLKVFRWLGFKSNRKIYTHYVITFKIYVKPWIWNIRRLTTNFMNAEICNLIFKIMHTSILKHNKDHALDTIDVKTTKVYSTITMTIITWETRQKN